MMKTVKRNFEKKIIRGVEFSVTENPYPELWDIKVYYVRDKNLGHRTTLIRLTSLCSGEDFVDIPAKEFKKANKVFDKMYDLGGVVYENMVNLYQEYYKYLLVTNQVIKSEEDISDIYISEEDSPIEESNNRYDQLMESVDDEWDYLARLSGYQNDSDVSWVILDRDDTKELYGDVTLAIQPKKLEKLLGVTSRELRKVLLRWKLQKRLLIVRGSNGRRDFQFPTGNKDKMYVIKLPKEFIEREAAASEEETK